MPSENVMTTENARRQIDAISIATPCPMKWSKMNRSDIEATRFCDRCHKHVHDVSRMQDSDVVSLLDRSRTDADVCVRLFRRPDGTIVTASCPPPPPAPPKRRRQFTLAMMMGLVTAAGGLFAMMPVIGPPMRAWMQSWIEPTPPVSPPIAGGYLLGSVCFDLEDDPFNQIDNVLDNAEAETGETGENGELVEVVEWAFDVASDAEPDQ